MAVLQSERTLGKNAHALKFPSCWILELQYEAFCSFFSVHVTFVLFFLN